MVDPSVEFLNEEVGFDVQTREVSIGYQINRRVCPSELLWSFGFTVFSFSIRQKRE